MKEVADYAEVSVATVSRVINKSSYVSADLEERVMQAMQDLNYQPSALARSLRKQETHTIGILVPQLHQPFFSTMSYAVETTLFESEYRALICSSEESQKKEDAYIEALIRQRVDGVVIVPTGHSDRGLKQLQDHNVPFVIVDRSMASLAVNQVVGDNRQGGYIGMKHLLALGHHRIAVIGDPPHSSAMVDRMEGVWRALAEHGIDERPQLIDAGSTHQFDVGYEMALELLQSPEPPTAIFALMDVTAIGVMHAAAKLGYRLPQDLSVMGYDNIPLATYSIPGLTTVSQPVEKMGTVATRVLLKQIESGILKPTTQLLGMTLVIRESTAPPRVSS